jgi:hypothetical protein
MSAIGMGAINESRAMGYYGPKAMRGSIEPKAWPGCRLYDTGCAIAKAVDAIGHAVDHLHNLCGCKDLPQP